MDLRALWEMLVEAELKAGEQAQRIRQQKAAIADMICKRQRTTNEHQILMAYEQEQDNHQAFIERIKDTMAELSKADLQQGKPAAEMS